MDPSPGFSRQFPELPERNKPLWSVFPSQDPPGPTTCWTQEAGKTELSSSECSSFLRKLLPGAQQLSTSVGPESCRTEEGLPCQRPWSSLWICLGVQGGARAFGDAKKHQSPRRRGSEADCRRPEPCPIFGQHRCNGMLWLPEEMLL